MDVPEDCKSRAYKTCSNKTKMKELHGQAKDIFDAEVVSKSRINEQNVNYRWYPDTWAVFILYGEPSDMYCMCALNPGVAARKQFDVDDVEVFNRQDEVVAIRSRQVKSALHKTCKPSPSTESIASSANIKVIEIKTPSYFISSQLVISSLS